MGNATVLSCCRPARRAMLGAHDHRVINIDLTGFGGSALTDNNIAVPQQPTEGIL